LEPRITNASIPVDDSDDIGLPGPGSYNNNQSTFTKKTVPDTHQFFGSTVERFQSHSSSNSVGPGSYGGLEIAKPYEEKRVKRVPFSTSKKRF
jgi:hypothetical protein